MRSRSPMGGSRNRYARGEDSEPRTEAIAAMIAEHTPPALIPRPRRPDRPAAGRWPYTPHFEFMSPAASPAWMAARAAVAELSEADGRLLKDLILRRPRGTDQAPAGVADRASQDRRPAGRPRALAGRLHRVAGGDRRLSRRDGSGDRAGGGRGGDGVRIEYCRGRERRSCWRRRGRYPLTPLTRCSADTRLASSQVWRQGCQGLSIINARGANFWACGAACAQQRRDRLLSVAGRAPPDERTPTAEV